MTQVVLHIGAQKTGSSFLQRLLSDAREQLLAHRWIYPDIYEPGANRGQYNQQRLAFAFSPDKRASRRGRRYGTVPPDQTIAQIADQFRQQKATDEALGIDRNWLLSSERIISMKRSNARQLLDFLQSTLGAEVRVLLYLRRMDYLLPSWYSQRYKEGETDLTWQDMQSRMAKRDPNRILDRWQSLLEPGQLTVRPYLERSKTEPAMLADDFAAAVGLPIRLVPADRPTQPANTRLNAHAVDYLHAIGPLLPPAEQGDHATSTVYPQLVRNVSKQTAGAPPLLIPRSLAEEISRHVAAMSRNLVDSLDADHCWQEWLDQPVLTSNEPPLQPTDYVRMTIKLHAPVGPFDFAQADWQPARKFRRLMR